MTMLNGVIQSLSRWALVPVAALALVACGGGESDLPQAGGPPGPASFVVDAPPPTPTLAPGENEGATRNFPTGRLHYMVFSASSVAAGPSAPVEAVITHSTTTHDIVFAATTAFLAPGLTIHKDLLVADAETWNGVIDNGGIQNNEAFVNPDGGLLSGGNFFVYCSAGASYQWKLPIGPVAAPATLRAGAQVAISGNFVAMTDIAPLYSKTFKRFDCTDSAPDTTFGDRAGNLTMAFGGLKLNPAQVTAAFSNAGFTSGSVNYKRRAYKINFKGQTQYAIVALDQNVGGGSPTASVLYRYPD